MPGYHCFSKTPWIPPSPANTIPPRVSLGRWPQTRERELCKQLNQYQQKSQKTCSILHESPPPPPPIKRQNTFYLFYLILFILFLVRFLGDVDDDPVTHWRRLGQQPQPLVYTDAGPPSSEDRRYHGSCGVQKRRGEHVEDVGVEDCRKKKKEKKKRKKN